MKRIINIFLFILISFKLYSQPNEQKLKISKLTDNFYIFTTYRSYKGTPFPANGMYLVTSDGVVIFDTPWDSTQFQPLLDSIKIMHNKKVRMCIATHSHEDRSGGLEYFSMKGIKTFTTKQTDKISIERNEKRAKFTFEKDTVFNIGDYSFQTFYGGPGHTGDNIVIWFEKEKILYGGCLIKSTEAKDLGNLTDANVSEWSNTLKNVQRKFGKPKYIIPGHQNWESNKSLTHTLKLIKKYKSSI